MIATRGNRTSKSLRKTHISVYRVNVWNSLSTALEETKGIVAFKKRLKMGY